MNRGSAFGVVTLACLSGFGRAGENEEVLSPPQLEPSTGLEAQGLGGNGFGRQDLGGEAAHPEEPVGAGEGEGVSGSDEFTLFPDDHVFEPLLAFMKEPQFSVAFRRVQFQGEGVPAEDEGSKINAGLVAFGGTFGLWRWTDRDLDFHLQLNLLGGVFSQFNLDTPSTDLINSDFLGGGSIGLRWGALSSRLRLFHQSSHLGDEFLLRNPGVDREDISFEAIDSVLALEGEWWRIYGGGGYILRTGTGLDRGRLQWGGELYGPDLFQGPGRSRFRPVFGADFTSIEERDWDLTASLKGGLEWRMPDGPRKLRLLLVYLDGFIPFGQFFNTEKVENFGVELQFWF